MKPIGFPGAAAIVLLACLSTFDPAAAQLVDRVKAPNAAGEGIAKTLEQQVGADRGDWYTPESSTFIISRDPFRAIRRGRQLFQRKFSLTEGQGSLATNGRGDVGTNIAIGAGMTDSCAACHGRPRGSAGSGGDVATRPDSRDAPHLFGLGLKEMLADEITFDLRSLRAQAAATAKQSGAPVTVTLTSKGVPYGSLTAMPDGTIDTSRVVGVDPDLRVRPFFAHGGKISIREFVVGALNDEMGLQAVDPELAAAKAGALMVTQSGMVLDGSAGPPGSAICHACGARIRTRTASPMKFRAASSTTSSSICSITSSPPPTRSRRTSRTAAHSSTRSDVRSCHIANLTIQRDRRVADVETVYDTERGLFNNLFATAKPLFRPVDDGTTFPPLKQPNLEPFEVRNIFADFKRHDLGPNFHERNYDGSIQREFLTTPLWGVGTTAPYGHDGRSINLTEVILRHGGEAQQARDAFAQLSDSQQSALLEFLNSLVLFPPDDTASNLNPGDRKTAGFPQYGHGNIRLPALFNNPADPE